jgi:tetratricopeptide (TPR) repeat protein
MTRGLIVTGALAIAAVLCWRPLSAWWCLDQGDLSFVRGDRPLAAAWLERGLALEPTWNALLEDHARAVLDEAPGSALAELRRADCGEACVAEEGDAQSRLGHAQAAVDDYLAAHAVERVAAEVAKLLADHRYDDAIALDRALAVRLGSGMLAEADLATTYFTIGTLDERAAEADPLKGGSYHRDAIRSYRHASQIAPMHEDYLLALGYAEMRWGDRHAARDAFERLLDLYPHQFEAERALARLGVSPSPDR